MELSAPTPRSVGLIIYRLLFNLIPTEVSIGIYNLRIMI